ncbi:hypothetical protein C0Q70_12938 [Pomacea canaliculata]|uniref:Uncharacterized protein n=1 Tax=Pomacea canaliculata TaxID=400727 RepID=A0A2T7P2Y0_POMCA|nr:hypothetical protein C0Q70_12938 [Pomacea canaliculata]
MASHHHEQCLLFGDNGRPGQHAAPPAETGQGHGGARAASHAAHVKGRLHRPTRVTSQRAVFLSMDGGATGAAGPHVLCLVVKEHVQGQGRALDKTSVDDLVRETMLQRNTATLLNVQLGDRGAAGHAASPVEQEQCQGRVPVLRHPPRAQVMPVTNKSASVRRVAVMVVSFVAMVTVVCLVLSLVRHQQCRSLIPLSSVVTVPTHGQWNDWGSWSSCSVSCGEGTRTRLRTCSEPNACGHCEGNNVTEEYCNDYVCPETALHVSDPIQCPESSSSKGGPATEARHSATPDPGDSHPSSSSTPRMTRSGRIITLPARYKD